MPCDDCSRAEGCPPCVNESLPRDEPVINNRCKCSHDRFRHCYDTVDGPCSKPDCDCGAYAPVTMETVELPDCDPHCHHYQTGGVMKCCKCGNVQILAVGQQPWPEVKHDKPGCAVLHTDGEGNAIPCPDEAPAEPDVDPCGHLCSCEHAQHDHSSYGCCKQCDCERSDGHYPNECPWVPEEPERLSWLEMRRAWAPPQPERRPPLSVAYSVAGGHAYEVFIPGDASVTAEDGSLIIKHPDAQVLAIVRVAPIKEGS